MNFLRLAWATALSASLAGSALAADQRLEEEDFRVDYPADWTVLSKDRDLAYYWTMIGNDPGAGQTWGCNFHVEDVTVELVGLSHQQFHAFLLNYTMPAHNPRLEPDEGELIEAETISINEHPYLLRIIEHGGVTEINASTYAKRPGKVKGHFIACYAAGDLFDRLRQTFERVMRSYVIVH